MAEIRETSGGTKQVKMRGAWTNATNQMMPGSSAAKEARRLYEEASGAQPQQPAPPKGPATTPQATTPQNININTLPGDMSLGGAEPISSLRQVSDRILGVDSVGLEFPGFGEDASFQDINVTMPESLTPSINEQTPFQASPTFFSNSNASDPLDSLINGIRGASPQRRWQ
jgi:hypothetical protein